MIKIKAITNKFYSISTGQARAAYVRYLNKLDLPYIFSSEKLKDKWVSFSITPKAADHPSDIWHLESK